MAESATAFSDAYLRFVPPIRAKCLRLLGSAAEAEEVVQEVFLRLWQSGPPLPPEGEVRTVMAWLYRTCTHLAIDGLRSRKRRAVEPSEPDAIDALPCGVNVERSLQTRQLIEAVHARVPEDELQVAILCRVDGLGHVETAEVLASSERTVRRLLARFDERCERWRKEVAS